MHNLFYYSKNFRKITRSFWSYYPDKPNSAYFGNNEKTKYFDFKTKIIGNLPANIDGELKNIKIIVPLKNLSNFIFNLDFLMNNTEIELILKWSQNCVIGESVKRERREREDSPPVLNAVNAINRPESLKLNVSDRKLYVPIVTLQKKYENILY